LILSERRCSELDWTNKDWLLEDEIYSPKRKVNNKGSHKYPHIMGSFFSQKNQRPVEYESLNERMFYYFLELDPLVIRYYVQPIRVPMFSRNMEWFHIPDVLAFRQGHQPLLYQIKESPDDITPEVQQSNEACETICTEINWEYTVAYPKTLPKVLLRNISFLGGYLRHRGYYSEWVHLVKDRLKSIGPCSVNQLSTSFLDSIDPLYIKPLVYHLIAKGDFMVDVRQEINSDTIMTFNAHMMDSHIMTRISILEGGYTDVN